MGFGINSKKFIAVMMLLTVILFVAALWLWPRLASRSKRAVAGRISLLAACQLALVGTMMAGGNAYFGFYTSWKDLVGLGSQSYTLTNKGGINPGVDGAQLTAASTVDNGAGGTVLSATIKGSRSAVTAALEIYLPPQYNAPGNAKRDFPAVVVDQSGESGSSALMNSLLAQLHPANAVVVVVRSVGSAAIACTDLPGGQQGEQFWGQDLRTAISARFRVGLAPGNWGALADARNGTCPVTFVLADADRYSAAAVLGAWRPSAGSGLNPGPAWYLKTFPAPPSRLLLADLGEPVSAVLPDVRPPLQVTTAAGLTAPSAISWLAQNLEGGVSA